MLSSISIRSITARRLGVLAAALLASTAIAASAAPAQAVAARGTYVSIGDSLAFGYQPNLAFAGDFNPADYVGYSEDYATMRPGLTLANFGCPGETTTTLIHGTCSWVAAGRPTHLPYGGAPQLQAVLSYLVAHPDTSLISIDIGNNDLLQMISWCGANSPSNLMGCIQSRLPSTLGTLISNYTQILGALHQAAPHARLAIFGLYNPLALMLPGSDALLTQYVNPAFTQLAAGFAQATGADVRVVDALSRMNGIPGSPSEQALVCARTWECTSFKDIHPTDLGYQQMAVALLQALQ